MTATITIENYYDQPIELPVENYGWYLDVDRKTLRLSDHPSSEVGMSYVTSYYLVNPSDKNQTFSTSLYDIWFAPSVSARHFLVWADSFEDALEMAAEAALDMGFKGFFVDDKQMAEYYAEAREELGPDADEDEVAQQAETDLTYTESGWIISHEWGGQDVTDTQLLKAVDFVCDAYMRDEDDLLPNPGRRLEGGRRLVYVSRRQDADVHTPNARGGAFDEHAARELELYIENEYKLVGSPNSQGKSIEKNLERKIAQGKFDYERSIDAWAHLIESGAKMYCQEFGGTWHEMFSPATRQHVAERFAQHFADEHQLRQNRSSFDYDDYIISVPRMSSQRRLVYGYSPEGDAWGSMIGLARGFGSEREAFDWCQGHAFQRGKQSATVFREKHGGDVVQIGHVGGAHRGGSYQPNR